MWKTSTDIKVLETTFYEERDAGVSEASIAFSKLALVCAFMVLDLFMIFTAVFQRFVLQDKESQYVPKVIAGVTAVLEQDPDWKEFATGKRLQKDAAEAAKQAKLAGKGG